VGSLFLVRHATTHASEAGVNLGQHDDAPLTEAGRRLATRTGRAIRAELRSLPGGELRIVSSPARRCRQTAEAIATELGLGPDDLATEPGLWEIDYGAWEGLSAEACLERDPERRREWEDDPYSTSTPGGESGAQVAARAFQVLSPLEAWLGEEHGRAAVAVTHNHVVRLRLTSLLRMPMADYRRRVQADPGGYSLVTYAPDGPRVRRINALPVEPLAG
jgi:broad specificity phosphatase PhoE